MIWLHSKRLNRSLDKWVLYSLLLFRTSSSRLFTRRLEKINIQLICNTLHSCLSERFALAERCLILKIPWPGTVSTFTLKASIRTNRTRFNMFILLIHYGTKFWDVPSSKYTRLQIPIDTLSSFLLLPKPIWYKRICLCSMEFFNYNSCVSLSFRQGAYRTLNVNNAIDSWKRSWGERKHQVNLKLSSIVRLWHKPCVFYTLFLLFLWVIKKTAFRLEFS